MYKFFYKIISLSAIAILGLTSNGLYSQIDANSNKWFTNINDALGEPERVYKLDLSGQGLKEIPVEISSFINLVELRIGDNLITEIGSEFSENSRLEYIDLSGNMIESIDFNNLSDNALNLKFLILRENLLSEIDASINKLKFLSHLDLGGNFIEKLDDEIYLRFLKVLILDNNNLTEVPPMAIKSPKLKTLNLNANNIEIFDVRVFPSLIALDLGDNPLKKYNITISKLEKLILDWVDFTQLELLPIPLTMEILSLEHCNLSKVPDFVYDLYQLKELSVMHNEIERLDEQLSKCKKLKLLWVKGNKLEDDIDASKFGFDIR